MKTLLCLDGRQTHLTIIEGFQAVVSVLELGSKDFLLGCSIMSESSSDPSHR